MRVRLLTDWAGAGFHLAGAELDLEPATARQLLSADAAEPMRDEYETASVAPTAVAARGKPKRRKRK